MLNEIIGDDKSKIGYIFLVSGIVGTYVYITQLRNSEDIESLLPATLTLVSMTIAVMALSWILLAKKDKERSEMGEEEGEEEEKECIEVDNSPLTLNKFLDIKSINL